MKCRPIAHRLAELERVREGEKRTYFDLTILSDDELKALEQAVLTGYITAEAETAASKARRDRTPLVSGLDRVRQTNVKSS